MFKNNARTYYNVARILQGSDKGDNFSIRGMQAINIFTDYAILQKSMGSRRKWDKKELDIILQNQGDIEKIQAEFKKNGFSRTQGAITAKWRQLAKEKGIDISSGVRITHTQYIV